MEFGAKYHVVLNPDIRFAPETIESLACYMDAHEDVGQIMPKVFYPDGRLQYLCKLLPTPADLIFRRFLPTGWAKKSRERFELRFSDYDKEKNIPFLSGCFMFLRVEALCKVGLFDERFLCMARISICRAGCTFSTVRCITPEHPSCICMKRLRIKTGECCSFTYVI